MSSTPRPLFPHDQRAALCEVARQRRLGLSLCLTGWLHLVAFSLCYYLEQIAFFHVPPAYVAIWVAEFVLMGVIFRVCGGRRDAADTPAALELFIRRIWIAYFVLGFNLGSLNTLRGHYYFEFFPAIASLASFAFIVMAVVLDRRFFAAMLIMFGSGLLMAAFLPLEYLIFAIAWWLVLNGIGLVLLRDRSSEAAETETLLSHDVIALGEKQTPERQATAGNSTSEPERQRGPSLALGLRQPPN